MYEEYFFVSLKNSSRLLFKLAFICETYLTGQFIQYSYTLYKDDCRLKHFSVLNWGWEAILHYVDERREMGLGD